MTPQTGKSAQAPQGKQPSPLLLHPLFPSSSLILYHKQVKIPPPFPPPQALVPHMVEETRQTHQQALSASLSSSPRMGGGKGVNPLSIIAYIIAIAGSMAFIIYYARNLEAYLEDLKELHYWGNLVSDLSSFFLTFTSYCHIVLLNYSIFLLYFLRQYHHVYSLLYTHS